MGGGAGVAAATMVESKEWYLAAYAPENVPTSEHIKLRTVNVSLEYDSIPDQHVLVQLLMITVDPYLRNVITGRDGDLCLPQIPLNKLKLLTHEIKGLPGFTAWIGIEVIGNPASGSNVFISAAAGGVGTFAGQLAKLKGCRVVGSTGSDEKVQILKDEFGYDEAFNYRKESDFDAALAKYFPNGIDFYLDNVGGKMLEAVLNHVQQEDARGAGRAITFPKEKARAQRTSRDSGATARSFDLATSQAQVDKPRIDKCKKESFCVTDQEPEHFGDDALPRPPGLQRLAKS
ncbi:NADP(+)-dependent 2-alkenal reductase-like protein [Tanacetum coccineum]